MSEYKFERAYGPCKVIRGANQIGGSVVQIESAHKRIWVDFGSELSVYPEHSTDHSLIALMRNEESRPNAIFFTHIHGDHIGLLPYVHEDVDIYIGRIGKKMLDNINMKLKEVIEKRDKSDKMDEKLKEINKKLALLDENRNKVHFYKEDAEEDNYGDINFTALRVDHSVYDSYMLKFVVDGKVIIHTGDFRDHGRLGKDLIDNLDRFNLTEDGVDILITEGTMMSRATEKVMTEDELQQKVEALYKDKKYIFLLCSSTNIDSLASFYWATVKKYNKRAVYCNRYFKSQFELYTEEIGNKKNIWQYKFHRCYPIQLDKSINGQTQLDYMIDNGFLMIVRSTKYYKQLMQRIREHDSFDEEKSVFIYSMWDGYLREDKPYKKQEYIDMVNFWGQRVKCIHTSGHATSHTLARVIEKLKPKEAIIPIHTEHACGFYMLDIDNEYKRRIISDIKLPEKFDFKFSIVNDTRAFASKYTEMMDALKAGGSLHPFVELVNDHDDLELCFRGNSGRQCTIYYNNHEFFKISLVGRANKPRLSFNMNHARYYKASSKDELISQLENDFDLKYKEYDEGKSRRVEADDIKKCVNNIEALYNIRKSIMESYFACESDRKDLFEPNREVKDEPYKHIEKCEQQKLMSANTRCKDGYYIYDMEFAQPYKSKDLKEIYKKITGSEKQNKPDSLAVKFDADGKPEKLVFVELKSTYNAMKGNSSAVAHMFGMRNYINCPLNREFIEHRKKEAYEIIKCYKALGLHHCTADVDGLANEEAFMNIKDIELLLVISDNTPNQKDSALSFYKEHKDSIDKAADITKCRIAILKKNNFDLSEAT